uniref:Uncharacterized protein n=1 Tax=Rhizophora mucronata TaxID=61149 RepID=A0A2P2KCY2_RHIMU
MLLLLIMSDLRKDYDLIAYKKTCVFKLLV